jgi:hypothetical protein
MAPLDSGKGALPPGMLSCLDFSDADEGSSGGFIGVPNFLGVSTITPSEARSVVISTVESETPWRAPRNFIVMDGIE